MVVRVDEAGYHGPAADVDRASIREATSDLIIRPDSEDAGPIERNGVHPRTPPIRRERSTPVKHDPRRSVRRLVHGTAEARIAALFATGISPRTTAPEPGELRTTRLPPTASRRSAIPCRPVP
jgi:hypothetical protein